MRIIVDRTKHEIFSVVQTIAKDRQSWEDWKCLRIETIKFDSDKALQQFHANVVLVLETALKDKNSTVILSGLDEISIFCKDIAETFLKELAQQIMHLAFVANGFAGNFMIFDVLRDAEHIVSFYADLQFYACPKENQETASVLPYLPDTDALSPRISVSLSRKVLLVEDDPVTRWLVRTALKDQCLLAVATDGGKALNIYQSYKPDMVLLDIDLPDSDGCDIANRIRESDPGAWIIMFSSHDSLENIVSTLESGAKGFIAKPFSREKILGYIHECPVGA